MLVGKDGRPEAGLAHGDLGVYELLCVPVLAVDTGFKIIFINEKACEVTGYTKEDVRDRRLFDIASPGELKKKLLYLFRGEVFERDFTVRSSLVTRNGRVRDVEWQCRTMFQGIVKAGAVITFVDLTQAETIVGMAQVMAGIGSLETVVCEFMDLLSDPLNLKLARTCLHPPDGRTLTLVRAYPHGGVLKVPRHALQESQTSLPSDVRTFKLAADGQALGLLELTPYGGSALTADDEAFVGRLCGVLAGGISRLLRTLPPGGRPANRAPAADAAAPKDESPVAGAEGVESADVSGRLMSVMPHGVIMCDRHGRITRVNEAAVRILGIDRPDLEAMTVAEMAGRLGPSRKNGTAMGAGKQAICRTLKTGHPVLNDVSIIHVNGSRREINTSATPLLDTAGGITGCLATISDVTVVASVIRLGQTALKSLNVDDFIEESMDAIVNAAGLRLASLYLWDGEELKLRIMKGRHAGMPLPDCRDTPDPANPSLQSRAFLKGKPLLIKDYRRCASVRLFDPLARKRPVRSMAGVPLTGEGGVIGVLIAATGEGHPMDETTMAGLTALCSQMAAVIDRTLGGYRLPT